jgi:5-methylcytosine-specific restriction protein B
MVVTMAKIDELLAALIEGRSWALPPDPTERDSERDGVRQLLRAVFRERYHQSAWGQFQARNALRSAEEDSALYAGVITSENPTSGPYEGTSLVWFPGEHGSVAVLVIGTNGFGADAHILGRPGHRRRLEALARLYRGRLWVKPDLLDLQSAVPAAVTSRWPQIDAALKKYGHLIYAAVPITDTSSRQAFEDLLDLFASEHGVKFKGDAAVRWSVREQAMLGALFPRVDEEELASLLEQRRFVVLEGPPGTGKTRLALRVAHRFGEPTIVQFHPARTYEDFVVGLSPRPVEGGLSFEVRRGDLLVANERAQAHRHVLVIDEINRGDLARVLGEAIFLFEVGEPDRTITLPHAFGPGAGSASFRLSPNLMVLGTRNTADRSIASIDLAIRRRFAFVAMWPDLLVVGSEGEALATESFKDALRVFTEHTDEAGLTLVPGHAYFLDPRPDLGAPGRDQRVAGRMRFELLPLLRSYVGDRLLGPATGEVAGLADRLETRIEEALV